MGAVFDLARGFDLSARRLQGLADPECPPNRTGPTKNHVFRWTFDMGFTSMRGEFVTSRWRFIL
jgi:hypothetical protein